MELGGNERAFKYFNKHSVIRPDGKSDYQSSKLNKYRQDLRKEITLSLAEEGYSETSASKPVPEPQSKLVFETKSQLTPMPTE